MRYYRIRDRNGDTHLAVETEEGVLADLSSLNEEVTGFRELLRASYISGLTIDEISSYILSTGSAKTYDLDSLIEMSKSGIGDDCIICPLDPDEMWAGGVGNYAIPSETLSNLSDEVKTVYNSERPAMVYKGTASRLVGPYDNIGIREDIESCIAEGELVVVIYKGRLVAFSTGNEVAGGLLSQSLWWAVPSKVFKGSASLGPCIVTPESLPNPTNLQTQIVMVRDGQEIARQSNVTSLRKSPQQLVEWAVAHDTPPDLSIIYTGACVAIANISLKAGDVVRIDMEGIGYVENTVSIV